MLRLRRRELGLPEADDELRRHLNIPKRKSLPVEIPHWNFHDLRRTAATKMAENLKIAPHIVDKILNHSSGTIRGVAAVYNRPVSRRTARRFRSLEHLDRHAD